MSVKLIKKHILYQRWTRQEVIETIKQRACLKLPLNAGKIKDDYQSLFAVCRRLFGNWCNAMRAAGLNPDKFRRFTWTPEKLITAVKQWVKQYPERPRPCSKTHREWLRINSAVKRYFHGSKVRKEKLGISWPSYKWTSEKVIRTIQERVKNEQAISPLALIRENESLYRAGRTYFGSYRKAIEASGFDYNKIICLKGRHVIWDTEKVIQEIKKRYRQGKPLNLTVVIKENRYLYSRGYYLFGSWKKTLQAAGIDPAEFYYVHRK